MTLQQQADILLAQWQSLWPLTPPERIERIDSFLREAEFEEVLQRVIEEMEAA